jgi:hypothetical protein
MNEEISAGELNRRPKFADGIDVSKGGRMEMFEPGVAAQASLAATWTRFEQLSARLTRYLGTSEGEFAHLIGALDECWSMAESVQKANAHLAGLSTAESDSESLAIRNSMLDGCRVFREFLEQIKVVGHELDLISQETKGVLRTSNLLLEDLVPLTHIAFHLRLESCRLAPEYAASVMKGHEEMVEVLGAMKQAGECQENTLTVIFDKLSEAARTVERALTSYAHEAAASEARIHHHLELLLPLDVAESRRKAAALYTAIAASITEAVKVLQGHDAIRQRMEHILKSLAGVRENTLIEPGHTLLLERQQAKNVLEMIITTGSRIKVELNAVIASAQGLAGDIVSRAAAENEVDKFEQAVDQLSSLSSGVARLLAGEMTIGRLVLTQVDPIGELLHRDSAGLEALARSMKRLKKLALNVLVSADKMPSAQGIRVLSAWTSEAAERSLKLAKALDQQFVQLDTTLQSKSAAIVADVRTVESSRRGLLMPRSDDNLRKSRRIEYQEIRCLNDKAAALQERTVDLLQSLRFVDEGSRLLDSLDDILGSLLTLYPKPEKPLDMRAYAVGYTMKEQHAVRDSVFGGEEQPQKTHGRLTEPAEGEDYGANVELF